MFYQIRQTVFSNNHSNCWNAWPLTNYCNNVIHRQMPDNEVKDIEKKQYSKFVMAKRAWWLKWWMTKVWEILWANHIKRKWRDNQLEFYLNKWLLVCVALNPTDVFMKQRKTGDMITCGAEWNPMSSWHIVNIAIRDWKKYIISTHDANIYREVVSFDTWLFKKNDWRGLFM